MGNNLEDCSDCDHKLPASQVQNPNKNQPQQQNQKVLSKPPNANLAQENRYNTEPSQKQKNGLILSQPVPKNDYFVQKPTKQSKITFLHPQHVRPQELNGQHRTVSQISQKPNNYYPRTLNQVQSNSLILQLPQNFSHNTTFQPSDLKRSINNATISSNRSTRISFSYHQQPVSRPAQRITHTSQFIGQIPSYQPQGGLIRRQEIVTKHLPQNGLPKPSYVPHPLVNPNQNNIHPVNNNNKNIPKSETTIVPPSPQLKQQPKAIAIRQQLPLQLDYNDDFLTHHLKYELSLTKFTNMKRIRRRQIMQHLWLQSQWQNYVGPRDLKINFTAFRQSIFSAWMQRTFLDIWQQAHKDFFDLHLDYKYVRYKVAQQYMHEIFQLKQFSDSAMATLNFQFCDTQNDLNTIADFLL